MVDTNLQGSVNLTGSVHSAAADGNGTKWEPYWDETYKRYYWSDGNESVCSSFSNKLSFYLRNLFRFGKRQPVVLNRLHLDLNQQQQRIKIKHKLMPLVIIHFQWLIVIHRQLSVINRM